jgi:hypothetical protein
MLVYEKEFESVQTYHFPLLSICSTYPKQLYSFGTLLLFEISKGSILLSASWTFFRKLLNYLNRLGIKYPHLVYDKIAATVLDRELLHQLEIGEIWNFMKFYDAVGYPDPATYIYGIEQIIKSEEAIDNSIIVGCFAIARKLRLHEETTLLDELCYAYLMSDVHSFPFEWQVCIGRDLLDLKHVHKDIFSRFAGEIMKRNLSNLDQSHFLQLLKVVLSVRNFANPIIFKILKEVRRRGIENFSLTSIAHLLRLMANSGVRDRAFMIEADRFLSKLLDTSNPSCWPTSYITVVLWAFSLLHKSNTFSASVVAFLSIHGTKLFTGTELATLAWALSLSNANIPMWLWIEIFKNASTENPKLFQAFLGLNIEIQMQIQHLPNFNDMRNLQKRLH